MRAEEFRDQSWQYARADGPEDTAGSATYAADPFFVAALGTKCSMSP